MRLGRPGAAGFAALFSARNAPSHLGGGFSFRGVVVDGVQLAMRGMCFFMREGLGWETAWERGFGCRLCHPESGRGESETGMLAGSLSAWVPKMPSGNQESVGVSPANTPDEARGSQSQEWTCRWGRIPPPTATGVSLHF